jgi:phosphoglycerol transferase MdoB-like AlkP superfamily enzyme
MSVSTMARLAEGDSAEPDSTLQSALRVVAAYIPAEAIAIYIAVLGLLNPTTGATTEDVTIIRFICFVIGVVVSISLPFVTFKGGNLTKREQRRRQVIVAALAAVAFAVYAATMPSFFVTATILGIGISQWAAVVAILVALFMPMVAKALKVRR